MRSALLAAVALVLTLAPAAGAPPKAPLVTGGEIDIPPGGFAAFAWDPGRRAFVVEHAPPVPAALPPLARRAIARAPAWVRDDLSQNLRRLLLRPTGENAPRDRDLPGRPEYLVYRRDSRLFLPFDPGSAAHPAAAGNTLFVGALDGEVHRYEYGPDGIVELALHAPPSTDPGRHFAAPAFGDADGDGEPEWIVRRAADGFVVPCFADLDGDGHEELLSGTRDGRVLRATGEAIEGIDVGGSAAPAAGDLDGDGRTDLVVGAQDGTLHVYLGPDLTESPDATRGLDVGELAAPCFLPPGSFGGGGPRLLVGRLSGRPILYDVVHDGNGLRLLERDSFAFVPDERAKDVEELYEKYYFPEAGPVLAPTGVDEVEDYARRILGAPRRLVDEIAYAVAATPADVLRAMRSLGGADLVVENARTIYDTAAELPYVRIVEKKDGTTLAYADGTGAFVEIPRDVYYPWVVHPRLLYEIPARIDASWWEVSAEERGLTDSKWWKHEADPDIHAPSPKGVFWRQGLLTDTHHGKSLLEAVGDAKTLKEAVVAAHRWMAEKQGFMRFGYETNDLQPWLVYWKRYGSCGEHSILCAAAARTVLIPTAVVGCRGEDHQWNEWFHTDGEWHHWDICGADCYDQYWSEGKKHQGKSISTVTRWRGDDFMDTTTTTVWNDPSWEYTERGAGYTDTAPVTIRVVDPAGRPVDGALVMLKSHWRQPVLLSVWGYTNGAGEARFELGWEPHGGYTVEILTPLGMAGALSLPVEEGRAAVFEFVTPGEKPTFARLDRVGSASAEGGTGSLGPASEEGDGLRVRLAAAELRPPNLITSRRYRIGTYLADAHGYEGSRECVVPVDPGYLADVIVFTREQYEAFVAGKACEPEHRATLRPGEPLDFEPCADCESCDHVVVVSNRRALFTWLRVEVAPAGIAYTEPLLPGLPSDFEVASGGVGVLTDLIPGSRDVVSVRATFAGRDVFGTFDPTNRKYAIRIDAGDGGPLPPADYDLEVVVTDMAGNESRASGTMTVTPARRFTDQQIRQDDPDEPLSASWTLGPFLLDGTDRFLLVETASVTPEFDMDMYLYRDRNGNGRLDGAGELFAKATSPSARERIYRETPPAGMYWLRCQGWKVTGESASLDVSIYPPPKYARVLDRGPVGRLAEAGEAITATFADWARVDPAGVTVLLDGHELTGTGEVSAEEIRVPLPDDLAADVDHSVVLEAGGEKTEWTLHVDTHPPELEVLSPEAGAKADGKVEIRVRARDDGPAPRVTARLATGPKRAFRPVKDEPDVYAIEVEVPAESAGERFVWIVARDAAGHETERVLPLVAGE